MKKQGFSTQVCGLAIGVAGALAPFVSAQAADELADRYINGYLNDPYTNEVAPERASVFPGDVKSIKTSDASGAQGPIRDDSAMSASKLEKKETFRHDKSFEFYTGYLGEDSGKTSTAVGAQGPIRDDSAMSADKPEKKEVFRHDKSFEFYTGYVGDDSGKARGAEGPVRTTLTTLEDKPMGQQQSDREWFERYSP